MHALLRMVERRISVDDVRRALADGETIEQYVEERPYPSRLVLGWVGGQPLHVVAADDPARDLTVVITAYQPDPKLWEPDFRRRRV
jgi:hypothetical protein